MSDNYAWFDGDSFRVECDNCGARCFAGDPVEDNDYNECITECEICGAIIDFKYRLMDQAEFEQFARFRDEYFGNQDYNEAELYF